MTTETLMLIITGFFTAISGMIISYVNRQNSSIKEQFEALKDVVKVLHDENDELCKDINDLKAENKRQYRLMQEQENELSDLRRETAEKDGSIKQLKAWAELLVKKLTENGIKDIPQMPDREATQPRHDVNHDRGSK